MTGTDYSYYHTILEAAFQFLSPLQQNLLKFCLSLHSYSATIQAFQQVNSVLRDKSIFYGWYNMVIGYIVVVLALCYRAITFLIEISEDLFINRKQSWH